MSAAIVRFSLDAILPLRPEDLGTPVEIPLPVDLPLYEIRTRLDGKQYLLTFDWIGRENRWRYSVSFDGRVLLSSRKLICHIGLLDSKAYDLDAPPGVLMAIDFSDRGGDPPGYADLGRRVRLVYFPALPGRDALRYDREALA